MSDQNLNNALKSLDDSPYRARTYLIENPVISFAAGMLRYQADWLVLVDRYRENALSGGEHLLWVSNPKPYNIEDWKDAFLLSSYIQRLGDYGSNDPFLFVGDEKEESDDDGVRVFDSSNAASGESTVRILVNAKGNIKSQKVDKMKDIDLGIDAPWVDSLSSVSEAESCAMISTLRSDPEGKYLHNVEYDCCVPSQGSFVSNNWSATPEGLLTKQPKDGESICSLYLFTAKAVVRIHRGVNLSEGAYRLPWSLV